MGSPWLVIVLALVPCSVWTQNFEGLSEQTSWSAADFPPYEDNEVDINYVNELLTSKINNYLSSEQDLLEAELSELSDLIDLEEEVENEVEGTEELLKLLHSLEDAEDGSEEYLYPEDLESNESYEGVSTLPQFGLGLENYKRLKRSPSPGIRRSSSSSRRSSSSRGSSSGSSSSRWGSRSSSSSRGSSTSSSRRGSSSSGSRSGSSSSSGSSSGSSYPKQPSSGYPSGGYPSSSTGIKPSTGAGIIGGAGAGAAIGATSGSSNTGSTYPKSPSSGYPSGVQPSGGYPTGSQPTGTQPAGGYPSGTRPVGGYPTGTQPAGGYPTGTQPAGGYPTGTQPAGGYPTGTQPAGGYPSGTRPIGGYPTGTQPAGGYPTGTQPAGGYPSGTRPVGGYPTGTQPVGGYPAGGYPSGTRPVGGYPTGAQPAGGYPTGTQPVAGYPGGIRPVGSYPSNVQPVSGYPGYPSASRPFGSNNQPYGGYPTANQPYGGGYSGYQPQSGYVGYSAGSSAFGGFRNRGHSNYGGYASGGFAAGALAGSSYPSGGFPKPLRKKTKKEKVKDALEKVATVYVARKAAKKSKFLSPFGHKSKGFGGGALAAGGLGLAAGGLGKKILGAYVKIQIAKYALKFGAGAAKAYFQYKLGRELDDYMIGKFVHRYHQHRVRGGNRWQSRNHYHSNDKEGEESDNITLGEFCLRPCNQTDRRICQFSFEVHLYQTLSRACYDCPSNTTDCERPECLAADGVRRLVTAVNKGIPGPSIQVCLGDKVLVDVYNNMPSSSVSLHWHGLTLGPTMYVKNATATPFMDGTPGVTQCPIPPGSAFRYAFDASDPGTHFWHAQIGLERGDGVFGPLVVHQPTNTDPMQTIPEHMFLVNDWFHSPTRGQYVMKQNSGQEALPKSILINGQGRHQHDITESQVPYFNFIVEKQKRYRLRVINAASTNCPMTISVDSHDLILLSADGSSVNPVNTSSILINPGERYDAMFSAEQESADNGTIYWIRVDGGNDCKGLQQFATLQYLPTNLTATPIPAIPQDSKPPAIPSTTHGMNNFSGSCDTQGQRCVSGLRSSSPLPESIKAPKASQTFYLAFSTRLIHNENIYSQLFYSISDERAEKRVGTPQINNLSFRGTSTPLLVNQRPLKSENCSSEGVRRGQCTDEFCECLHVIQVDIGATVDMVLIGEGNATDETHPVHLHGFKFWVLAQVDGSSVPEVTLPEGYPVGMSREKVMKLDEEGSLNRYLESPMVKDTIAVPQGGYTIIRIVAENKGFWMLESQVLFNSQAGMSLILQVGTTADLPKPPKDFPTC